MQLAIETKQVFTWTRPTGESLTWDIGKALRECPHDAPVLPSTLEDLRECLRINHERDFNMDYVMQTDPSRPGLVIKSPWQEDAPDANTLQLIIIDGWHRMMRAVLEHRVAGMTFRLLSSELERACRV